MNNLYLYNAKCIIEGLKLERHYALIFFHHTQFDFDDFLKSLNDYFESYSLPEKVLLLIPNYLTSEFRAAIDDKIDDLCRVIPTEFDRKAIWNFIQPFYYNSSGEIFPSDWINESVKFDTDLFPQIFNNALVDIFIKREGLIKSENAHHFVFPSGKHCNFFLRPGNILVKGNEIYFIAFNLLKKLKDDDRIIYCDTSSINSIAFALIELKRRFAQMDFVPPYIESFGSYSAFENSVFTYLKNSVFLISSSTSSRIIDRLLEKKVDLKQVALIFCMGRKAAYRNNIICDLLYNESINPNGIRPFKSYELAGECDLCKDGSIPVEVTGDVFQIEKPKLNVIELKVTDTPRFHQEFIRSFYRRSEHNFNFIKSHYYEAIKKEELAQPSYEIFLDVAGLMKNVDKFKSFKEKLDKYITQYIPSKTKFLIHLPDKGSYLIAEYIKKSITSQGCNQDEILLINQNDLFQNEIFKNFEENASAVIICSSMVSGSRLLYISREMRDYSSLSLIYFVGFSRTEEDSYFTFVKNNLTMGKYGINTNVFVEVEQIYTPNERQNTIWVVEEQFLINLKNYCEDTNEQYYSTAVDFFNKRLNQLDAGYKSDGIFDTLFYPNIISNKVLSINKNFAFYRFSNYRNNASQSDVFFTISIILNSLRNSTDLNRKITNSHFVRTLLQPNNFNRFNDGIIQAALLRAAHSKELNYDLDKKLSFAMLNVILAIVEFSDQDHGEALLEFLYAIAIKKLRLKDYHIKELFDKIKSNEKCRMNTVICAFLDYCEKITFGKDKDLLEGYSLKLDFD